MQVSVESASELSRKMTVQVPESAIQDKVVERLKSFAQNAKLDGFRPGKVPKSVIKKRFGGRARQEVIAELIQSSFSEAIKGENLMPVGDPQIEPNEMGDGKGLEYVASFEVLPEITLFPFEQIKIKRLVSEITDHDIDDMIEKLREQRKSWESVDRGAKINDRLTINFDGKVGEENFTDGTIENFSLILGENKMIPGFEDKLVSVLAADHLSFELEFPADYLNKKLAAEKAEFEIDIVKIEKGVLPDVDENFIKAFDIESGDLETLREELKENMEREMRQAIFAKTKAEVMDALLEKNSLTLPDVMVQHEIEHLLAPHKEAAKKENRDVDDSLPREEIEQRARRRVTLGIICSEIIKANKLKADKQSVRKIIENAAASYEQPDELINWYYSNPEQLNSVEQRVLEDQVIEWVIERANVIDEPIGFKELTNLTA